MARNKFILYEPLLQKYTFIPGHALKCAPPLTLRVEELSNQAIIDPDMRAFLLFVTFTSTDLAISGRDRTELTHGSLCVEHLKKE